LIAPVIASIPRSVKQINGCLCVIEQGEFSTVRPTTVNHPQ
jgi:hypothetical protein